MLAGPNALQPTDQHEVAIVEPFRLDGEHVSIDLAGARALFTTRRGGCSHGPYESLNLGRWTDDEPDAVQRNRASLQAGLGVRFAYGRQVHGPRVRTVDAPTEEGPMPEEGAMPEEGPMPEEADGQATDRPGVAPMVLTADCLPVAIAGKGAVAMIHAGWRGLADEVLAAGVAAVRRLSADGPLVAAIGPGAGGCCYEVGDEVRAAFADEGSSVHHGRNIDLKAIARRRLERAGVSTVHDAGLCTICSDPSLFFSHRRDKGVTGRQAGIAWLVPGAAAGSDRGARTGSDRGARTGSDRGARTGSDPGAGLEAHG